MLEIQEIHSWHRTGIVEQEFKKLYGLNVRILRHQSDVWIQTAGMNELSLGKKNEIGRSSTQGILHSADKSIEQEKPL